MMTTKKALSTAVALLAVATMVTTVAAEETKTTSSDTTTSTTSTTSTSSSTSADLGLAVRIEGNYKTVGTFKPLTDQKVYLYKVVVSYPDGAKDYVFTVPATASSFVDWHARQNMVNKYMITAYLQDGTSVAGGTASVVMGANGEPSTEDAIASHKDAMNAATSTSPAPSTSTSDHKSEPASSINDAREKMQQEIEKNRSQIEQNKQEFALNTGVMKDYLKNPLTDADYAALKAIFMAQQAERDVIIKDTTLSFTDKQTKLQALLAAHMNALLPYVATDKVDAFKAFVAAKTQLVIQNQELRKENKDLRDNFQEQKKAIQDQTKEQKKDQKQAAKQEQKQAKASALSKSLHDALLAALDKIPAERKVAVFTKVLSNVDAAIAKVTASDMAQAKKDRTLAQLTEIKSIVQDKLDALSNGTSDASLLNDILSGTNTTGAPTTQSK